MNAYNSVIAVTGGNDVLIPIRASTFCAMFDLTQTTESRRQLLEDTVKWLKRNPEGIWGARMISKEVQPAKVH